jgi:hypothetical protein
LNSSKRRRTHERPPGGCETVARDGRRLIAVGLALLVAAAARARLPAARRRARARSRRDRRARNATSVDPETEAVTSVQKAELLIDRDALVEIWTPENPSAWRTYWRF